MQYSKIIKSKLSPKSNKKELYYREEIQQNENEYNSFNKWEKRLCDGRVDYLKKIMQKVKFHGSILELGAGSTWFGSELSKLSSVKEVYCLDFSEKLLTEIAPKIMGLLNANTEKITRVVGDFYELKFKDNTFDMVVIDAALHHITVNDIDIVLSEIKRVLKKDGMVVAIREPIVPSLRPGSKKTFGLHERSLGLVENIYTKKEWATFFNRNGFRLKFLPLIQTKTRKHKIIDRTPLKLLNGLLFAHYVLIAKRAY